MFNNYLKKKIKFDFKNFFFNEYNFLSNSNAYKFFLDSFSKIYGVRHANNIWKIKKKVFFDKIFWWNHKYRLIRVRQEQRRRKLDVLENQDLKRVFCSKRL